MEKLKNMSIAEIGGYIGMVLIHGATMPTLINRIFNPITQMPPLSMVLMIWLGLALFLAHAIKQKDTLYTISNAYGFIMQSVLLALIVFPKG